MYGIKADYEDSKGQLVEGQNMISKVRPSNLTPVELALESGERVKQLEIGFNEHSMIKMVRISTDRDNGLEWGKDS